MKTKPIPRPANWQSLRPHALSALTEFGAGIEIAALQKHIREHGYDADEAIILHEGQILDGRHKHAAAKLAGVIPTFREFVGRDAAAYVCKKLFRQHLDASQRALMAATLSKVMLATSSNGEGKCANLHIPTPPTQAEAAAALKVSRRSVSDAAKVQEHGTSALNQAVIDGTIAVSDAAKVVNEPSRVQDGSVDAVRNGKAKTAAAAANLCKRCRRVGKVKDCPRCAEIAQAKPNCTPSNRTTEGRRKKPGTELFDWPEFWRIVGPIVRKVDGIAAAYGEKSHGDYFAAKDLVDRLVAALKQWQRRLTKTKE